MSKNSQILNIINDIEKLNEETSTINGNIETINSDIEGLESSKQNKIQVTDTIQISKLKTQHVTLSLTGKDLQTTLNSLGDDISDISDNRLSLVEGYVTDISDNRLSLVENNLTDISNNKLSLVEGYLTDLSDNRLSLVENNLTDISNNRLSSLETSFNNLSIGDVTNLQTTLNNKQNILTERLNKYVGNLSLLTNQKVRVFCTNSLPNVLMVKIKS